VPRQKGDSSLYIITVMQNGLHRAECYRDECHWWEDYSEREEAEVAMKDHRKVHRKISAKKGNSPVQEENKWLRRST